jgi:DNA repair protein RecO (recombination protein O)
VPGPATLTQAIVVGAIRYGETSRIVRLATRDLGVQSAIAKGAMRPKSRFGTSLQLLTEGTAHLIPSRGELATLAAFDASNLHHGLARSVPAFHAAAALAELAGRFVPPIPQEELFVTFRSGVEMLELAPEGAVEVIGLAALWRFLAALGFAPSLEACARDAEVVPAGPAAFSIDEGGVLCGRCAAGHAPIRLAAGDRDALQFFLEGTGEVPDLDPPHAAAHRRLFGRWVARHLGDSELPALTLWLRGR